jgi:hypothetical protein
VVFSPVLQGLADVAHHVIPRVPDQQFFTSMESLESNEAAERAIEVAVKDALTATLAPANDVSSNIWQALPCHLAPRPAPAPR